MTNPPKNEWSVETTRDGDTRNLHADNTNGLYAIISCQKTSDGTWGTTHMMIGHRSRTVSSHDLRTIPLATLIREGINEREVPPSGIPHVPQNVKESWPDGDRELVFDWVNRVYIAALAAGRPPTKTVAEQFGVNSATGARLTRYARAAGVLVVSSMNDPRQTSPRG